MKDTNQSKPKYSCPAGWAQCAWFEWAWIKPFAQVGLYRKCKHCGKKSGADHQTANQQHWTDCPVREEKS